MRPARKQRGALTPVNLRECYVEPGAYSAKFLIDPAVSAETESVSVRLRNADGIDMLTDFKRWGTKLTLSFIVNEATPDGVAMLDVTLIGKGSAQPRHERFRLWVIK